jgi:hypothetical protein
MHEPEPEPILEQQQQQQQQQQQSIIARNGSQSLNTSSTKDNPTWEEWAAAVLHLQVADLWHICYFVLGNMIGAGLLALGRWSCGRCSRCCCPCWERPLEVELEEGGEEPRTLDQQIRALLTELERQRSNIATTQNVSHSLASQAIEQQREMNGFIDRFATELREMRLARFGKYQ